VGKQMRESVEATKCVGVWCGQLGAFQLMFRAGDTSSSHLTLPMLAAVIGSGQ
jgi:hypothetical protein